MMTDKPTYNELEKRVRELELAESEHKNMMEALRESEQFRGRIIQSLMSGLYIYNLEKFQNDFISDQYTVLTGWTLDEINAMGQRFFELFHPEERAHVKEHFHNVQKMKNGEVLEIEYRFRTKDGRWICCLSRDTVFERNEHGDTTRFIGSFFDITERKRAETMMRESKELYEQLAAHSRTIAWELDEAGLYTYISPVVEDILGYRPEEIVGRLHFYDLHPEKGRDEFKAEVFAKMQRKEPASEHDNVLVAKDGRFVWVTTNGTPVVNAGGSLCGYRGSDKDITKRKEVENDLKLHKVDLEEKNKELQKVNIALEVVMESIEQRQKKIEEQLLDSLDFVVTPILSQLKSSGLSCQQKKQIDIIQANLNDVFSPLAHKLNRMMRLLTGTEAQIVGLLKHGLSSKEIATQLGISTRTVDTHRRNIRKKLGINGRKKDLRSYLLSLDSTE